MEIRKFRKKPVEIEAVQLPRFPGDQAIVDSDKNTIGQFIDLCTEIAEWCKGESHMMTDTDEFAYEGAPVMGPYISMLTIHNDVAFARSGDWIIAEPVAGRFYPCDPEVFEKTYEEATLVPFEAESEKE